MKIKLEEYIRDDGANPYQRWFDGLDAQAAAKVTVAKTRLELSEVLVSTRLNGGRAIASTSPKRVKR